MKSNKIIYNAAIKNGIVNAIIYVIITWFTFSGLNSVPISLDAISNTEITVFSTVFSVVLGLTFIRGIITFFTFKKTALKENLSDDTTVNKPFFPKMLLYITGRALTVFGVLMIIAVLWQRIIGTIHTSPILATIVVAIAAGLAAAYIVIQVSKEVLRK